MLFDDVLEARQPELLHELGNRLSEEEVEAQLARYAEPVRNVVPDFFEGSDAALLEGEAVIRERVKTNPQELTVWLRSEASEVEEAHARAEAERTSRPEVRISIRRKRLPAARRPFRVNAAQRGTGSSKRQSQHQRLQYFRICRGPSRGRLRPTEALPEGRRASRGTSPPPAFRKRPG